MKFECVVCRLATDCAGRRSAADYEDGVIDGLAMLGGRYLSSSLVCERHQARLQSAKELPRYSAKEGR